MNSVFHSHLYRIVVCAFAMLIVKGWFCCNEEKRNEKMVVLSMP
jgi:hypothetical protein